MNEYIFYNNYTYSIEKSFRHINHNNPQLLIITTDEKLPKMGLEDY